MAESSSGVGQRMKEVRADIGVNQPDMAATLGMTVRPYQDYESGKRLPSAEALQVLAKRGFDLNWILTGVGSKYRDSISTKLVDKKLLRDCIIVLRDELKSRRVILPPDKEAEVISLLYDIAAEQVDPALRKVDPTYAARILRLVS